MYHVDLSSPQKYAGPLDPFSTNHNMHYIRISWLNQPNLPQNNNIPYNILPI